MSKELFKEAIADAKAVREAALANAKAALEEALTPKLQSMLAAKLQEIEEIDEAKEEDEKMDEAKKSEDEKMEEGMMPDVTGDTIQDKYRATGAALEEADEELEEDFEYKESQLDREVTSKAQIRLILETYRDRLYTEIFPGRTAVPKTLIFAPY